MYVEGRGAGVFFTLTDRAPTIPSNTRDCQSGTWSAGQKQIKGTEKSSNESIKTKSKPKTKEKQITKFHKG